MKLGHITVPVHADDTIYLVQTYGDGEPFKVFGHKGDADTYAALVKSVVVPLKVLDHAEARELIEKEEG